MKIENINIVLPDKIIYGGLVFVEGKIVKIRKLSNENPDHPLYILPGIIDPHVHLRDPGFPEKETVETGTEAALHGGITTLFDMPNTNPPTTTKEALEEKIKIFEKGAKCNWRLFVGATKDNLDFIKTLDGHDKRIAGIKVYLGSSTGNLLLDDEKYLLDMCNIARERNLTVAVHAEMEEILIKAKKDFTGDLSDPSSHSLLRPREAVIEGAKFAIELCRKTKARIHVCHVSDPEEINLIKEAKRELPLTCEISPNHLFLNTEDYKKFGNKVKCNPPIRDKKTTEVCLELLKTKGINMIGTDHGPHLLSEKEKSYEEAPSGIPGLETALPLLLSLYHEGKLSLIDIANRYSRKAARFWNLNKGEIREGRDADFIILDMGKDWVISKDTLKTKCGWSPYEGLSVKGKLREVYINGDRVLEII